LIVYAGVLIIDAVFIGCSTCIMQYSVLENSDLKVVYPETVSSSSKEDSERVNSRTPCE